MPLAIKIVRWVLWVWGLFSFVGVIALAITRYQAIATVSSGTKRKLLEMSAPSYWEMGILIFGLVALGYLMYSDGFLARIGEVVAAIKGHALASRLAGAGVEIKQPVGAEGQRPRTSRYSRPKLERLHEAVKAIRRGSTNYAAFGGVQSGVDFKGLYAELEVAGGDFTSDPQLGQHVQDMLGNASLMLAVGDAKYLKAYTEQDQRTYLSEYDLKLQQAALDFLAKSALHIIYDEGSESANSTPPIIQADRAISALRRDHPAVGEALSDLIARASALEHFIARTHPIYLGAISESEAWAQDYSLWVDAALALLRSIGRSATANVFQARRHPNGIYASASLVPLGVSSAQVDRLRAQREILETLKEEYA